MPKFVFFLCLMLVVKLATAQPLKGTYVSQSGGRLEFVGDSVSYKIDLFLTFDAYYQRATMTEEAPRHPADKPSDVKYYATEHLNGIGTWFVKDSLLFFKPLQIAVLDTGFKAIPAFDADKIKFKVTTNGKDGAREPVVGGLVMLLREKLTIAGAATYLDGVAALPRNKILPSDTIKIMCLRFHSVKFIVSNLYDYDINLVFEWDKHPEYATNGSEHFLIRLYPDSVQLQLPVAEKGWSVRKWVTFVKQ